MELVPGTSVDVRALPVIREVLAPRPRSWLAFWALASLFIGLAGGYLLADRRSPWSDVPHNVEMLASQQLDDRGADRLGERRDVKYGPRRTVTKSQSSPESLRVTHRIVDDSMMSEVSLNLSADSVSAVVSTGGDPGSRPTSPWLEVSGQVRVSTLNWSNTDSLVVQYDLYGLKEGGRRCIHGKVALRP